MPWPDGQRSCNSAAICFEHNGGLLLTEDWVKLSSLMDPAWQEGSLQMLQISLTSGKCVEQERDLAAFPCVLKSSTSFPMGFAGVQAVQVFFKRKSNIDN